MSIFSSDGEVFGAKALYGAIVVLSAFTLFAAVASTTPAQPAQRTMAAAPQVIESVVVTAPSGSFS